MQAEMATPEPAVVSRRSRGPAIVARPTLWERLRRSGRVTVVSAPAGSGKTVLLTSWIDRDNLADRTAFVQVGRGERDPQRFWLSVLTALRATSAGSGQMRELTASPDLDEWAILERLLSDLAPLADRLWLVLDDVHELRSEEGRKQLELFVLRAPPQLRIILATRHDIRLGLHRLRLEGGLTEIRTEDLRFTVPEARELFEAGGLDLTDAALTQLYERTEGWAAGLRLAALSLAGRPDAARFAAEFSGTERTVTEYLLAEVLERQPPDVRRLMLRTSVLERVNGQLADLLTEGTGGERALQTMESSNAFIVSLDTARSWFRYHHLFADLLQLELRNAEPEAIPVLHELAAGWLAANGYPAEAIRHAQAAQNWALASSLVAGYWLGLYLDGRSATVHALMSAFPAGAATADAGLAAAAAGDELAQGSLAAAERYLALAESASAFQAEAERGSAGVLLDVVRLLMVEQTGDQRARGTLARRLLAGAESIEGDQPCLGSELRTLALISLGDSETWTGFPAQAEAHLDQAMALARRIGRPYLEFMALIYRAGVELTRRIPLAAGPSRQAIELAERHGWTDEPFAGLAYMTFGSALAWQGRLDQADPWVRRAERTVDSEDRPVVAMGIKYLRGQLELARGQPGAALAAFEAGEPLGRKHPLVRPLRAWLAIALVRLGEFDRADQLIASIPESSRARPEMRISVAMLCLVREDPDGAAAALAPVLNGSAPPGWRSWLIEAFLLEAAARETLGERTASGQALERALGLAEADRALLWFLLYPLPELLAAHARDGTRHRQLASEILSLLAASERADGPAHVREPLSKTELRILRYLPTHLSAPEIAAELHVSTSTVKTHLRNLYTKLDAHSRTEAVAAARSFGLLAPSASVELI
jgi:LuxR family transcriptional regulator, maltose regulon positive regulatory protein